MNRIPKSIARRVTFKAFLAADHVTAATGKTIPVQISKNGAAFANLATPSNATEIGSGWYYVDLAIADISAFGPLIVRGTNADIDPVEVVYEVDPFVDEHQAAAKVALRVTGTVYFVSTAGNDSNDGLTPYTPKLTLAATYALMTAGDGCIVGPGIFVQDRAVTLDQPTKTKVVMSGIDLTILDWSTGADSDTVQYHPNDYTYASDFTIRGTPEYEGGMQYGMGAKQSDGDAPFVGVVTERVKMTTWCDGFYIADAAAGVRSYQWTLIDCIVDNQWDTAVFWNTNGPCDITLIRPKFYALSPAADNNPSRGITATGASCIVKVYEGDIHVKTLSTGEGDYATAVKTFSNATVILHGGSLRTSGVIGSRDIWITSTGGTVIVAGTQYDRTKTYVQAGSITEHATDNQAVLSAAGVTAVQTGLATPTNITAATGVVLASNGLDSVATTAPAGVASNFREMVVQTWRRFFKKSTLTATQLKTYDDAGTGVLTTQTVSDDSTTQTQGTSS